jgi:hypothetical protein
MPHTAEAPAESLPDHGDPVPEFRPPRKHRRFPSIESLSHAGTVLGAMCGILALLLQLSDEKRERVERVRVEAALPEIADDGRVQLRLIITNDSDRPAYIKRLVVSREMAGAADGRGQQALSNMLFARDTSVKIEALEPVSFKSSPFAVLGVVGLGSGYQVEVETSQREYTFQVTPFTTEHRSELLSAIGRQMTAYDSAAADRLRVRTALECKTARAARDTVNLASTPLWSSRAEVTCLRFAIGSGQIHYAGHAVFADGITDDLIVTHPEFRPTP